MVCNESNDITIIYLVTEFVRANSCSEYLVLRITSEHNRFSSVVHTLTSFLLIKQHVGNSHLLEAVSLHRILQRPHLSLLIREAGGGSERLISYLKGQSYAELTAWCNNAP